MSLVGCPLARSRPTRSSLRWRAARGERNRAVPTGLAERGRRSHISPRRGGVSPARRKEWRPTVLFRGDQGIRPHQGGFAGAHHPSDTAARQRLPHSRPQPSGRPRRDHRPRCRASATPFRPCWRATSSGKRAVGLPRWKIARMIGNVAVDAAVGAIPVAGDAFDLFFKANERNLRIINEHLSTARRRSRALRCGWARKNPSFGLGRCAAADPRFAIGCHPRRRPAIAERRHARDGRAEFICGSR